jgi:hypothetical protein
MRVAALITVLSGLALATPALAGTVNFTDGRGTWQPTKCTAPQSPSASSPDAEAGANDLNARVAQHNQYVAAADAYMSCLSEEAQTDANGVSQAIVNAAQSVIQQTQAQVAASAAQIKSK